jgi:hypothetical protein
MDVLFDVRFLAKLAIAFGFKMLGEDYGKLSYTERLRRLLRTRRSNLETIEHQVRMKPFFHGLQDHSFKHLGFPHGFVFLLNAIKEGLVLGIIFPSGHHVQVSITDGATDPKAETLIKSVNGQAIVSIPPLNKTVGPIDLAQYIAWKVGSHKMPELDGMQARFADRANMPPLR